MSPSICYNFEKDGLVANAVPNANPKQTLQSSPFLMIWSLLSRTIDQSIDWSIVRLCLCLIHSKHFDPDRIWLYWGVAMAGQETYLWDQYLGLDLLPPSVRVGFRTRCPTSVQNLGSRDPRLTKLALDQASHSSRLMHVDIKKDVLRKIWLNSVWDGILGLSN